MSPKEQFLRKHTTMPSLYLKIVPCYHWISHESIFPLLSHKCFFQTICLNQDLNRVHTFQLVDINIQSLLIYKFISLFPCNLFVWKIRWFILHCFLQLGIEWSCFSGPCIFCRLGVGSLIRIHRYKPFRRHLIISCLSFGEAINDYCLALLLY